MKFFLILLMTVTVFAEKAEVEHNELRYFPTSWTAPNISGQFVTGSAPVFDGVVKTGPKLTINWIHVEEKKVKTAVFTISYKKETKVLKVGQEFELAGKKYLFIGPDSKGYVIKDLKTKKRIKFRMPVKKKVEK